MLSIYRQATTNQFLAALSTLKKCVEQCPENLWHEPVVNLKYCQVVFYALFFTDVYLGPRPSYCYTADVDDCRLKGVAKLRRIGLHSCIIRVNRYPGANNPLSSNSAEQQVRSFLP
ncbi:MAG: hypothetical protein GY903_05905 [Fuerstiella sp.]|nr:hypothetical protein [Fuerstiella sp.]MCP4854008.1 hypothetical protein [Fuerstiella sp.]